MSSLLKVESISKTYHRRGQAPIRALDSVGMTLSGGEILGVMGPNGAGKSTLLRLLAGLQSPDTGTITYLNGGSHEHEWRGISSSIGYLSPTTLLYKRLTVRECLDYFFGLYGVPGDQRERNLSRLNQQLTLTNILDRRIDELSSGQYQRVSLARAMLHDPDVLILDEPMSGLDVLTGQCLINTMRHARDSGKAVLFSSHHLQQTAGLCNKLLLLHEGTVVFSGILQELLDCTNCTDIESAFLEKCGEVSRP